MLIHVPCIMHELESPIMRRFVITMAEDYDYFFILYLVGFCAEGWLAVLALLHYPSDEHLEILPDDPNLQLYEVGH